MASPSELSLDCKPHSYSMLLKSFGDQQIDQTWGLEEFLSRLEEERLKIDAFKRELPLCMQLLTNAVEASRQQLHAYRANEGSRPVLEEFIPLKNSSSENSEKSQTISDKADWMTTAQLWSQAGNESKPQPSITSHKETDIGFNVSPKLALDTKQRNGGAFLPFSKDRNSCTASALQPLPDLALASVNKDVEDKKCSETENGISCQWRENSGKVGNGGIVIEQGKGTGNTADGQTTNTNTNTNTTQPHRKARRCWSPDLHRRFVNALQMLGGSQVATPKQIRELMKVEGLTNDEVKSHLQKYRLHTRRPSPSPQAAGAPTPQLVVLGGIWVPPEYATAAAAVHSGAPTLYGAHHPAAPHAPPHFCASPVPQEFYTAAAAAAAAATPAPPPPQLHHHTLHHQLHMYRATSQAHSSPESDIREAGDRSESIEDGKSESSSWKGESGDNGGDGDQRKGLAALREEGEESNGSEITLKF
ncbi:myb family transcription factor EFM-like [Durio zibethinus]|uniref:Myb family transcription factor EFM-like n=1 Tax=Durio zibethinus TaxID=66656 RepID=A0A6P5XUD2_DURZI|nr:myb family transcription factor EFM-like [Durio zibethinus]